MSSFRFKFERLTTLYKTRMNRSFTVFLILKDKHATLFANMLIEEYE